MVKTRTKTGLELLLKLCYYSRDLIPSFAHLSDAIYKVFKSDYIE